MDPRQHMLQGRQTGMLIDNEGNGLRIMLTSDGYGVQWQRIINNVRQPILDHQISTVKDVYDSRQGSHVAGFELMDSRGNPTGEVYRLNEFDLEGNISYGGGEII